MNQDTRAAMQRIIEEAKAKAAAQVNRKPAAAPPPAPEIPQPTPPPPVMETAAPVQPELSNFTIEDIIGQPKITQPVNKYNLQLIQYSDKAVAVIGDTAANKSILKALGGRYNPFLTCGKGWIFSKKKEALIRQQFNL